MLWLLCCLPVLTGCIGEEDYANDPVGNFEQLWKIIDEQYCFLEAKGIDWDAVHDKYSPLIIPTMSNDDLFDILSQMLYILKDITTRNISSGRETIIRTSRRLMICQMDFCGRVEYFYKRVIRSYHY